MIVLGIDTSTAATAVALRLADASTAEIRDDPAAGAHPGHATRLLQMAGELLAREGLAWRQVDRIAVGLGPGTFTGLRVGLASARALAQSLSAEIVGVSSPRALAMGALAAERADAVLAVTDARRGEAFAAAYAQGERFAPRELAAPRALAPGRLASVLAEAQDADGMPEGGSRWLAVGDGALRFREQLDAAGVPSAPPGSPLHLASAVAICELGARAAPARLQEIVPDYRRRPDAELALQGARSAKSVLR
ncbi:MAG TPA: tRNA (adenosine(37)-N6)-threonylcarbamoyltransferase complex dimerization subunit type 1 TsaB [Solirubrobacteraceae bacterium]|nr:tRNA (adenosine(37)-N6)-threonylcarbamoyltransferase complex dimerization subunit type 1 TsaB [Solirubrobacteraceae bacterium]